MNRDLLISTKFSIQMVYVNYTTYLLSTKKHQEISGADEMQDSHLFSLEF